MNSKTITRRDVIRGSFAVAGAAAGVLGWSASSFARQAAAAALQGGTGGPRRLIVIELRGGLDGMAFLQPRDGRLAQARPTLAKRDADLHPVADDCGLHPRLGRLGKRFAEGRIGLWRGVGHDRPNLSHFESRDHWDEGVVADVRSGRGWLGALGESFGEDPLTLLAIGDGALPGALRGTLRRPPAVRRLDGLEFRGPGRADSAAAEARVRALERLMGIESDAPERAAFTRAARETADAARRLRAAEAFLPKTGWPRTRLANDLAAAAAVILSGLPTRVLHVVHNGYDTHADQAATLDRLLAELDGAVDALLAHLEAHGASKDVLVMTTSEFGRRLAESGSGGSTGTDHGTANVLLLAGGSTRAGLFGAPPDLERLDPNGNVSATVDFRCLYAGVLQRWFDADPTPWLGSGFPPLDVVA